MKANYKRAKDGTIGKKTLCFTEKQLNDYLDSEWKKREKELYSAATKDISAQLLAVFFSTLYQPPYKWRKERLLKFKHNVDNMFLTMSTGVLGKKFGTEECIEFMKKEFDIDFDKEVNKLL